MKRKIIGIGETILDILFRGDQPISAYPGGSTFNAMVSLGRVGINTLFISEVGNDRVGDYIRKFLSENGVNSEGVAIYRNSKTPISLAYLNDKNDAEYLFYRDAQNEQIDFICPEINKDDIILFGSYYALNPIVRQKVEYVLKQARSKEAIIYYDINFRQAHKDEVIKLTPNLLENFDYATIVRGSREDFQNLFKKENPDDIYESEISFYSNHFIFTNGSEPIIVHSLDKFRKEYKVQDIDVLSTVGAGDNFNAGFIFGLLKNNITIEDLNTGLTEHQWDDLVDYAQAFSINCCKDIFNYISCDFAQQIKQKH